jgi:hypothetical protein
MFTDIGVSVAVAAGLTQVFKKTGLFPSKFAPLVSLVCGIVSSIVFSGGSTSIETIGIGLIAGLTASGAYDLGTKTVS